MTDSRSPRSQLERMANGTDANLYAVILAVERLWRDAPNGRKGHLSEAITSLRAARTPIRMLMHKDDREATI